MVTRRRRRVRPSTKENTVPLTTALPSRSAPRLPLTLRPLEERTILRIVPWIDPVADPHGVHPCSRYVELYWLGVIGPSTIQYEPVGPGERTSH
jgi:hypothetical protein